MNPSHLRAPSGRAVSKSFRSNTRMWKIISFFLLYIITVDGFGFRGFHYEGRDPPAVNKHQKLEARWIEQPLDHFNVRDNRTWQMRFYENDIFFNGTGAILIMLGGEWEIAPGFLQSGLMFEVAKYHGAMMYYTEHRYYGKSRPVSDTQPDNLQYLNVDQALADVAFFIETQQRKLGEAATAVVVFGGSYAGNMAAWARLKYPHLIQGALASSAPVHAKIDFFEYYQVVANSLGRFNKQCVNDTKAAFITVENLLTTKDGPQYLKKHFNLCDATNVSVVNEVGFLMNSLAEIFAGTVQYNKITDSGKTNIAILCEKMMDIDKGTPFQRLAGLVKKSNCIDWSYTNFLETYRNSSWDSKSVMRLWIYQTCTEYGYYQTSNTTNSTFGTLFPLNFFIQMCTDLYGNYYGAGLVDSSVRRTNIMYGGPGPIVKNVIFSNGNIDPWHALSVLEDLNDYSPAIFINGTSHVEDLYQDLPTDSEELKSARQQIRSIIAGWISPGKTF